MPPVTDKITKATPQRSTSKDTFFKKPGEGFFDRSKNTFFGPKESTPFFAPPVQAKLSVNEPGDAHEKEADATADKVMRMSDKMAAPPPAEKKEEERIDKKEDNSGEELQLMHETPAAPPVQNGDDDKENALQRKGENTPDVTPSFEQELQSSKGGGSPLPDNTRQHMEAGIGADFSGVRVHTGSQAAQLSTGIQAQAFTHGSDIYFNEGKYSPGTDSGKHLLAHELTHTVQQGASATSVAKKEDEKVAKEKVNEPVQEKNKTTESPVQPVASATAGTVATVTTPTTADKTVKEESGKKETAGTENELPDKVTEAGAQASGTDNNTAPDNAVAAGSGTTAPGDVKQEKAAVPPVENKEVSGSVPPADQQAGTIAGAETAEQKPVIEKAPSSPADDPAYQAVIGQVTQTAEAKKQHPDASKKAGEIDKAASGGAGEVDSRAKKGQVEKISEQKPKPFDRVAFKKALMEKIKQVTPANLEEADEFKEKGKAGTIKPALTQQVKSGKAQAQGDIKSTAEQSPSTSGIAPKPVTPLKDIPAGKAASLNGKGAAPKPKTELEVTQEAQSANKSLDDAYAADDVTSDQLQESKEPEFVAADNAKKDSQQHISESTVTYRNDEQAMLNKADQEADGIVDGHISGMHKARVDKFGKATGNQKKGKDRNEAARTKINTDLQQIYATAKADVERSLATLDRDVNTMFDAGEAKARKRFEDYVDARMTAYKDERYSGVIGKGKWLSDKLFGMPDYVNRFYVEGKKMYTDAMDQVLDAIAGKIETTLTAATTRVTEGRTSVKKYLDSLSPAVKKIAQEEGRKILAEFDGLQQTITDKQTQLIDALAKKYTEKLAEVDKRITEMKEANKGWVDKALSMVAGVIKTIRDLKNTLMSALQKAIEVIGAIIRHPITFLGNMIEAIGNGFKNFAGNILEHLKNGVFEWLMGAMPAGIEFPKTWDLKGIFSFVMQILGLTWPAIRARAVKLLGSEKLVKKLEGAFEIFQVIRNEGLPGLWRYIQEQVGNLQTMVIDAIMGMLQGEIVEAGIKWLLGLLTPAGAFVKACMAIIDIVKWFINNATRIMDLITSITDGISDIVAGNLTAASNKVEQAMKKIIPITIGFLASLLGVGDLATRVQGIIQKITAPIHKAIDWVLDKAVEFAKKTFGKLTGKGEDKKGKGDKEGDDDVKLKDKDVHIPAEEFTVDKEQHTLFVNDQGDVMIASIPKRLENALSNYKDNQEYNQAVADGKVLGGLWKKIKTEDDDNKRNNLVSQAKQKESTIIAALKKMHYGDGVKQAMELAVVNFNPDSKLNKTEYQRQLDLQEAEINKMKVGDWQTNRARYIAFGRNKKDDTNAVRRDALVQKMMHYPVEATMALENEGLLKPSDSTIIKDILADKDVVDKQRALKPFANRIMDSYGGKQLAVLHTLDQIAGGLPDVYGDESGILGSGPINSSIGSHWDKKINIVDEKAKGVAESAIMNVKLNLI